MVSSESHNINFDNISYNLTCISILFLASFSTAILIHFHLSSFLRAVNIDFEGKLKSSKLIHLCNLILLFLRPDSCLFI